MDSSVFDASDLSSLLPGIARLVAAQRPFTRAEATVLLLAADRTPDSEAVEELLLWAQILERLRKTGDVDVAHQGLLLRGVPYERVVSAIQRAATSSEHGDADTSVLGVKPLQEIVVAPDGSGTHKDLASAIAMAEEGAVIHLSAGIHEFLAPAVVFRRFVMSDTSQGISLRGVTLVGAGLEHTEIVSPWSGILFNLSGGTILRDLTVRSKAGPSSNPLSSVNALITVMMHGTATIERCRFIGAQSNTNVAKAAVLLGMAANVHIRDSIFEQNDAGIVVDVDSHDVLLQGNTCVDNKFGIVFSSNGSGIAQRNRCHQNGECGILVNWGHVRLEENECAGNGASGIVFTRSGTSTAQGNNCTGNGHFGISVEEAATPVLTSNTCRENGRKDVQDWRRPEERRGFFRR